MFFFLTPLSAHTHTSFKTIQPLPADQQDSQQQPDGAGESAAPADGDADPEADHAGGSGHREELPGLPAGASGAAAQEHSGRTERRSGHQHERPRECRWEKLSGFQKRENQTFRADI